MLILYHADFDGICSAAIAYRHLNKDARMLPVNYDMPMPFNEIGGQEHVWVLDYGISEADMDRILGITPNVKWIDHHKTSMKLHYNIPGIRSMDKSACELTWEFLYPSQPMPWTVKFIGDRDTWKWQFGDGTRHFYNGLQAESEATNPTSSLWDTLLSVGKDEKMVDMLTQKGIVIEKYKMVMNQQIMDTWAYEIDFEGYKCLALNCPNNFDRLSNTLTEKHQIGILYVFNGEKYIVSLYTIDDAIDVSVIAKKHGGGGHPKASGFVTTVLPFARRERSYSGIA